MEERPILQIIGALDSIGGGQIANEPAADPLLGFRMWGGKDSAGNITRWLAKGKAGQLLTLQLIGATTYGNGLGIIHHDAAGNLTGGPLTASEVPNHDALNGKVGTGPEYYHLSASERFALLANMHAAVTKSTGNNPLTLTGQALGLSINSTLTAASNILGVNQSALDHGSIGGLGDDDHTQYSRIDAARAFTAAIAGVDPTSSNHLTTKNYVDAAINGVTTDWQDSCKSYTVNTPPASPAVGDRYIVPAGASTTWGHPAYSIVQWSGSAWVEKWIPSQAGAVGARTFLEDTQKDVRFFGGVWVDVPSTNNHSTLLNLASDDHPQYLKSDGSRALTGQMAIPTPTVATSPARKDYTDSADAANTAAIALCNNQFIGASGEYATTDSSNNAMCLFKITSSTSITQIWSAAGAYMFHAHYRAADVECRFTALIEIFNNSNPRVKVLDSTGGTAYPINLDIRANTTTREILIGWNPVNVGASYIRAGLQFMGAGYNVSAGYNSRMLIDQYIYPWATVPNIGSYTSLTPTIMYLDKVEREALIFPETTGSPANGFAAVNLPLWQVPAGRTLIILSARVTGIRSTALTSGSVGPLVQLSQDSNNAGGNSGGLSLASLTNGLYMTTAAQAYTLAGGGAPVSVASGRFVWAVFGGASALAAPLTAIQLNLTGYLI